MPLIAIDDLEISIRRPGMTDLTPVRSVTLGVEPGETLALVGESGCGKSMTCLAIAGLLPRRARVSRGAIRIDGHDLARMAPADARPLRRLTMASVFQDATNGLNPVRSVGWQIAEAVRLKRGLGWAEAKAEAVRLLGRVGMPDPERRAREYPHQFSGGMNQRAMIALAIAGRPKLLIADEATTALDVTVQAQILALIEDLKAELGMAVIFVTHDLGIVAETADRVAVMYAGRIVETAPVGRLFARPVHPYTRGLLDSLPGTDPDQPLRVIEGSVPALDRMPAGCAFAPRCDRVQRRCRSEDPVLAPTAGDAAAACHAPLDAAAAA